MNSFFKIFGFGKEEKKTDLNLSEGKAIFPKFNYLLEFLKALNKTPTDKLFGLNTYWEGRYKDLLGNLTPIVKTFVSSGLLEISLKEESLRINELKEILKKNGLTVSGNKEELAKRVFEKVENKSYQKNLTSFYKLTPAGKKEVDTYEKTFQKEYSIFLQLQADLFSKGNLYQFELNHFKLDKAFPDQRSLGGKFGGFSQRTIKILTHLKNGLEFRFDWNFDPETKKNLRSSLALRAANFSNNKDFLSKYLSHLDLSEFKDYLQKNNPMEKEKSNVELLEFFLDFEFSFLWNLYCLKEFEEMPEKFGDRNHYLGVQIWNKGCECEEKFGIEKFNWNEIDKIPTLPRTPNCGCHYSPYTEND
ncbi:MAG: SAP domain-containing protein [Algoriphagus aquaeductus]|uniref:SAP domain-containing protein n=1 Tax=Algoriphagus aquaeductus TaxID=475299 RepID=UPI00391AABD3